jgi:translation initiation factor 1
MNDETKIVWSDEQLGDTRKKSLKNKANKDAHKEIDLTNLILTIRRLTSGKGRTIIEIGALPTDKNWCKKLAKDLKKKLGVGGAYKKDVIEVHGEKYNDVAAFLDQAGIKHKKTGG